MSENFELLYFKPAFSVMCLAISFAIQANKMDQNPPITAHWNDLLNLSAHLHRSDLKQTPACIGCDWLTSNSMSNVDVKRIMSNDVER